MPAAKHSKLYLVPLLVAAVACAFVSGCVTHRHEARPVSAILSVEVTNADGTRQWRKVQRMDWEYLMLEPYQTLPTVELEALERQAVADGDWPKVSAIRILLEQRKLGLNTKEE